MGRSVIKPDPGDNFYVVYSSITDLPVFWGTRKQVLKNSKKHWDSDLWLPKPKDLEKADYPDLYGEDIDEVVWLMKGTLPLSKLKDMCRLLDLGIKPDDPRMLEALDREGWDD